MFVCLVVSDDSEWEWLGLCRGLVPPCGLGEGGNQGNQVQPKGYRRESGVVSTMNNVKRQCELHDYSYSID